MPGKRVAFDEETWAALDLLARDRMMDFQELADEAFRDLLKKHGRPTELKVALRRSVEAANAGTDKNATVAPKGRLKPRRTGTTRAAQAGTRPPRRR